MTNKLKLRLVADRARKSKMAPEFRSIFDVEQSVELQGTFEVTGTKERNGNVIVEIRSYFETEAEKSSRLKKYKKRPLKLPKKK